MNLYGAVADALDPPPLAPDLATPSGFAEAHSRGQWRTYPHLQLIEDQVLAAITEGRKIIVSVSVRHGKALAVDTPIPTPSGWTPIGELVEGDEVFDEDGAVCSVTGAFDAYDAENSYTVHFSDGSEMVTDGPHRWVTYSYKEHQALGQRRRYNGIPHRRWPEDWAHGDSGSAARSAKVRTTAEMAEEGGRFYIPNAQPIDTKPVDLLVDPYLLGVWLGDGTTANGSLTTADPEVIDAITSSGREVRKWSGALAYGVIGLQAQLRELGVLGNKHVPQSYMRASIHQRLDLLRGLMDSDGGVERSCRNQGRVSFTNQNEALVKAVGELFVSLGAKVTYDERPAVCNGVPTGRSAYRVSSSPPFCPFSLPRKADLFADDSKGSLTRRTRVITAITRNDTPARVRCIAVDSPSHLYLAGEQMIPTHNTEFLSRWLLAWYLGRHPDKRVILAAHSAEFAATHGRIVRNILTEHGQRFGVKVSGDSAARNNWNLASPHHGGMLTVGVDGPVTGYGADLLVIDDPVKDYAVAMSPLRRQQAQEWWSGTMASRVQPGGAVVLIMARWHEDDLAGWLLREAPDEWTEVRLPAIADDPNDPMGRQVGEALWPEQWPLPILEKRRADVSLALGEAHWLAQYQQRPTTPTGGVFPADRWVFLPPHHVELTGLRWVRAWDLAATDAGGDWTAGVRMARMADGRTVVGDVVRGQWSSAEVRGRIAAAARADPDGTRIVVPQDPGQAGKDQSAQLVAMLAGHHAVAEPQTGSKEVRATGWAAQQQAGNVVLVEADWNGGFVAEHQGFPRGTHDDQVDAASSAFNALVGRGSGPPRRYTRRMPSTR